MRELVGVGASRGTALGGLYHYNNGARVDGPCVVEDVEAELARFEIARCRAIEMIGGVYRKACAEIGARESMIFQIHQMMLADQVYLDAVQTLIRDEHYAAQHAVQRAGAELVRVFSVMENAYMNARGADILDISNRILRLLRGEQEMELSASAGGVVLVANELLPSEMIGLGRTKVAAVVTAAGSGVSHSAMLARAMGIPAVMGVGNQLADVEDGVLLLVDGERGVVLVAPDEATILESGLTAAAQR